MLFIGNSYVKYGSLSIDIPATYKLLADGAEKCVAVNSAANLGWTLSQHATDAGTAAKINSKPWDIVVLQDQSDNYYSGSGFLNGARALKTKIKANNACTRVMLYLIPAWNDPWSPSVQTTFTNKTKSVQNTLDEATCPTGEGWRKASNDSFSVSSLFDDGQHPSELGEYLISSAFFARIHKESAVGLITLAGVTAAQAAKLQGYADAAVFSGGGTNFVEWEDGAPGGAFAPKWCSASCPSTELDECGQQIANIISTDPAVCSTQIPYSHLGNGDPSVWLWYSTGCGCGYKRIAVDSCPGGGPVDPIRP